MKRELKEPKLLSSGDVRQILGVSYQFVEKLVESGKLPFYQVSSGRIFRECDVLEIKAERLKKAKIDKRIKV